jgi:hypothetical protein
MLDLVHRSHKAGQWYVTNGETTVGPVHTELLLRGVWHGRIPDQCWVRESGWHDWRSLDQIREIRALARARARGVQDPLAVLHADHAGSFADLLTRASDVSEVLLLTLGLATSSTGAARGLAFRSPRAYAPPLACYATGPGMLERLGTRLVLDDPSLQAARGARVHLATENDRTARGTEGAFRCVAGRFSVGPLAGVAIVPVVVGRYLVGLMELARSDHPFRAQDALTLGRLAREASRVIHARCG